MSYRIPLKSYSLAVTRSQSAMLRRNGVSETVKWAARIIVKGELDGKVWEGFIFFPEAGTEPLGNSRSVTVSGINRAFLYFPREQYDWCVDMLRNEKPVFLVYSDRRANEAYLTTEAEPVGEGETDLTEGQGAVPSGPVAATPGRRSYAPFEENSTSHSLINGYLLAHASRDIYGDAAPSSMGTAFSDWFMGRFKDLMKLDGGGEPLIQFINDDALLGGTGVQCMIMSNERFAIVVFRGTQWVGDDILDMITNTLFAGVPVPASWGYVTVGLHNGWLGAVDKIYPQLIQAVKKATEKGQRLWLTGHSLGGAMALIAGYRMTLAKDAVVQGINTYGCPPVGGGDFYTNFGDIGLHARTRRWVNNRDIVPQLPLPGLSAVGKKSFIDANGEIFPDAPVSSVTVPSASDHGIPKYAILIRDKLTEEEREAVPL